MRSLALILAFFAFGRVAHADAPTYGKLRVTYDVVNIYEGASANSKLAGTAESDQEFELRGDKLYDGFYKIQYGKKVCFVMAGQVKLLGDLPKALPTEAPTPAPTKVSDDSEDDDGGQEIVLQSDRCTLKKGAGDDEDDDDDEGAKGQRLVLKDKTPRNGYYKCELKGRTVYVKATDCVKVKKGQAAPTATPMPKPAAKPTLQVTARPTVPAVLVPVRKGEGHEDEGDDEEGYDATKEPTAVPTKRPTPKPTAVPTEEPTEEAPDEPTAIPTKRPTLKPTAVPTEEPTEEATQEPTAIPTKRPTLKPTSVPTEEPTEEPTAVPTQRPTLKPTDAPIQEPTAVPTKHPTLKPTDRPTAVPEEATEIPTAVPTLRPTARPTAVPTAIPTAVPTPTTVPTRIPTARPTSTSVPTFVPVPTQGPSVGRAKRRQAQPTPIAQQYEHRERRSSGAGQILFNSGTTFVGNFPVRDASKLADFWLYMPLGVGKHQGSIKPAFKPDDTVADIRYIESSAFLGLGIEARMPMPWLRFSGDWTYFTHRTKAADQNKLATKVDLPAPAQASFPDSDVYYQVNTHAFRVGAKASIPGVHVEPWINGTLGAYVWSAEYLDGARELTYGNDTGVAFGGTVGTGIDFHFPQAHSVFTVTPFVEWGAPIVHAKIDDIGGFGQTWNDPYGTLVAPESRFGIQFAIGY